jgi:hypothetical protein
MRFTIVLLILVVPAVVIPAVAAQGTVDVDLQTTPAGFTAVGQQDGTRFQLEYDLASAVVTYALRSDAADAEAGLVLDIVGVAEFRDRDGDGRYGLGDETVRIHRLAGIPNATATVGDREAEAYYPWAPSSGLVDRITHPGGVHVRFQFAEHTPLPGVSMDVRFDRVPRTEEGTLFALLMDVRGVADTDGARTLAVAGDGADALLRWQGPPVGPVVASSILRTTDTTVAIATPLSDLQQRFFLEPHLHPASILPGLMGNPLAYALAFVAAAAAAGTPMALRLRRQP